MKPSCPANQWVTREMAMRGFAAVAVQYPRIGTVKDFEQKAQAVADSSNPDSAISVMTAHESVDAGLGLAMGGYSQGTHIAILAAKFNVGISAAFSQSGGRPLVEGTFDICDSVNIPEHLPPSKRRYVTGEADQYYAWTTPWVDGVKPSIPGTRTAASMLRWCGVRIGAICGSSVLWSLSSPHRFHTSNCEH